MPEVANQVVRSDSLEEILRGNPHRRFAHPILWRRWRRAQVLYQDFARIRIGLDDFEREIFVPQLRGRIGHIEELLNGIKKICSDPIVRTHIGPAITALGIGPQVRDPVTEYLARIVQEIDDFFLREIARIKQEAEQVANLQTLMRFVNSVRFLCSTIVSTRKTLFWYSSWVHLQAVDRETGRVVREGEPKEFGIILLPFKNSLENLVAVASTTVGSIDHWAKQLAERRKPFLEYLTANTMDSANRRTVYIQILTIILAVVLSSFFLTAADPLSLYRKNVELTDHVRQLEQASAVSQANQRRLSEDLETLRSKLVAAQREAAATSAELTRLREENADL